MVIYELSFRSTVPIQSIQFHLHQVDLLRAIEPRDLPSELGKLANQLRKVTGYEVVSGRRGTLLSSSLLQTCAAFRVIETETIDLTSPEHSFSLKQVINRSVVRYFESRNLKVNAYQREAFARRTVPISNDIEAQRYLKWDVRVDSENHTFLSLDYSSEYNDRLTVHDRGAATIPINQPLIHTYDGASCRFSGISDFTVSEPLESLGNISLVEYHRRKGIVSPSILNAIPAQTRAIWANYGSQGRDVIYPHIPQLLKKTFSRDDVDARRFNEQVWTIDQRFKEAIQIIAKLNEVGGLLVLEQAISFEDSPYRPQRQINFVELAKKKNYERNLDFGNNVIGSFPAQGLNRKQLLDKPAQIKAIVFHPEGESVKAWCQSFTQYIESFDIGVDLIDYRPYPLGNTLGIQRECRNLQEANLVLMCVPDKEGYRNNPIADPYPVLKRQFVQAMLPSQGIELSTIHSPFKPSTGNNLLLGVLGKLGHSPWQLRQMPGNAQAFVGLDVGRKDGRAVGAAAFVVNQLGRVIGWSAADFQAHRETFDSNSLRKVIFDLINLFEQHEQKQLEHLVIHRDGLLQDDEFSLFSELMSELHANGVKEVDVVEVLKSGYDRAGQYNERTEMWENPQRGWGWSLSDEEVALMTTGAKEIKGGTNFVPRPITIRRRMGNTTPGTLAAQVYWLSEMHIGSTQTIRLPITTYYADAAAEYALEGFLPTGIQIARRLPFL
ncbi:Piwi domain-containing protein [Leptolyngbya ohadii]|uniref:Piwi domain-containing protein n=1 Tax=Leptolyngbya ohadii TaxID=1962290 RepID=UPI0015C61150|nr:Piwi domain-containing protein [Leptolyngbya ohadii]